ncbi:2-deoxystreptamine glucosyltransferase [compost metagenome]
MPDLKKLMLFSHVCNTTSITGAEKLLLFLAKRLSLYYECSIVVPNEGKLSELARSYGVRIIIWDIPLLYGMYTPSEHLSGDVDEVTRGSAVRNTVQLLSEERPDYVFVNTCVHLVPSVAAKSLGIPVIWQITEVIRDNGHSDITAGIIDRYSDWIISISESAASPLRKFSSGKLSLLYPSWNSEEFNRSLWGQHRLQKRRQWGVSSAEKLVGYISSYLIAEKGPHHFIEAAAELGRKIKKLKFVLIGKEVNQDFYSSLKQQVKESGCAERFIFVDHVSDIESAYSAMDIVVVPSLQREGFGLTAMEAMIIGKPVVAYASGGLEEILKWTGNEHYLVAMGDRRGLAVKVSELLEKPGQIEAVGEQNSMQIVARFGHEAYETRLREIVACINNLSGCVIPLPELPVTDSQSLQTPLSRQRLVEERRRLIHPASRSARKKQRNGKTNKVRSRSRGQRKKQVKKLKHKRNFSLQKHNSGKRRTRNRRTRNRRAG